MSVPGDGFADWILDPRLDLPPVDRPRLAYLIASEPRTGSNLLCVMLRQSGAAGCPSEYLHRESMPLAMSRRGIGSVDAYLADVMRRRTTSNGVFGLKAHYSQIDLFLRRSQDGLPPGLRLIRLSRRDLVAQAVSFYIALRTGEWLRTGDAPAGPPPALVYDFEMIRRAAAMILQQRRDWGRLQRRLRVAAPVVTYEAIAADPVAACRAVLDHLGIAATAAWPEAEAIPQRQATERNAEWAARFRAEAARQGVTLP